MKFWLYVWRVFPQKGYGFPQKGYAFTQSTTLTPLSLS